MNGQEGQSCHQKFWISSPPPTIPCTIRESPVDILYSPIVGANIVSSKCALHLLGDMPLVQTDKTFQTPSGEILEGVLK